MNLEQIGLGLALTIMEYSVVVSRTPFAYGFRIRTRIRFRSVCTPEQRKCILLWAKSQGMDIGDRTQLGAELLNQWLDAIEPFHSLMNQKDLNGIKKIHWVRDNPIPKVLYKEDGTRRSRKIGKNWKKFMYWAEAWDEFCEGLE